MEDVDAAIEKQLDTFSSDGELRDSLRSFYKQGQGLDMVSSQALMEKTAVRFTEILTGNAPDLDVLDAVETAVGEHTDEEE